ncbi:inhibitor of Bruton tyrosine kinase isoform X2 [Hyposmocoma kahamanoa]|uniref:inhibitor of Bruton tyrosine kinase isoform X2 n=1 Tax=Hyposmocoma kahamanoa TaxID=1477025 RepID=UPI000E6D692F|nr:inhibitor of Bruton tyrosine kinase isoform X2 [Hyposmocoma kahamanoa]
MNKINVEVDCTKRCKSRSHGQALTSAITKRSVKDESLASFIKATCANFSKAFDFEGRTALHMSASRGRNRLMEWLVRHSSEAFVNARDRESGYTPLHRSIFYGQIHSAVALLKIGVNTDIVDKDDYKALEHAMLDRQYMYKHEGDQPSDVYVWGSNSNYTLATGTQQQRNVPEMLKCFSRTNTCVKQVCLGKFHSVWVCSGVTDGEVWCCGQTARAGGPHSTALQPTLLKTPEPVVCAAVTLSSTVMLLQSGTVMQYTLNTTDNVSQSSAKTPSMIKLPNIKPLMKLSHPLGVVAGRSHAVVWNTRAIYTWGTNLGQLGHPQEDKIVPAPKRVAISMNNKEEAGIQLVDAADAATVITTSRGDVYLLHKHICKKIAIKQINLRQVCVEAKVSEQGVYSRVTVLLLTNVGQLLIWQDTTNQLTRCVFGLTHQTVITNVTLTHDALYFTTKYGEAFVGYISRKAPPTQPQPIRREKEKDNNKSALVKFLEKDDCTSVKIARIPNVHRAVAIAVDNEGLNFACLQIKPTCGLTSLPELSSSSMVKDMETVMETASEDDTLHDLVFKVGPKLFPVHAYILATHSEHLYKLYQERTSEKPIITLENVHPEVFERILRYMYTGQCDVAQLGPCTLKIRREDFGKKGERENVANGDIDLELIENSTEISAFEAYKQNEKKKKGRNKRNVETPPKHQHIYCDPVKLVQASAKRLQVMALHKLLDKFYYRDGTICLKDSATFTKTTPPSWDRETHPELVDTNVCSKDGHLIPAHKCILTARLEYFQGMFMHSWTESTLLSKVTDEDFKKDESIEVNKKKRQKKIEYTESEKARMRYESVSSVNSLDLSNDTSGDITLSLRKISKETEKEAKEKQGKWIEVPSALQKQQKVVQARLKAVNSAKDILNETPMESFVKLSKNNSTSTIYDNATTSRMTVSPKNCDLTTGDLPKSPQGNFLISHVGPKLSQKQRKKLAMQGDATPQSLDNYMANKLNIESPPEKVRNPWKICEVPMASSSPKAAKAMQFNEILADQKKQKDDFSRIMTKPLYLTQLEDKAIEELERFYNIHSVDDEWITVRRIELQVSSPQWIHTAPK